MITPGAARAIKKYIEKEITRGGGKPREARIDPAYDGSGLPAVIFAEDLQAGTTSGPFTHLESYSPLAGDWVLLIPSRTTYVIVGKLITG